MTKLSQSLAKFALVLPFLIQAPARAAESNGSSPVSTADFLEAYQSSIAKERASVFAIETAAGRMMGQHGSAGQTIEAVVDFVSYLIIAPWLESAYKKVFVLYPDSDYESVWRDALTLYPTIDYFSAVHGSTPTSGGQFRFALPLHRMNPLPGQLRLVYTTACKSGSSKQFILDHDAGMTIGHAGYSMSPFIIYRLMRYWTEGASIEKAVSKAFARGRIIVDAVNTVSPSVFDSDGTEPMIAFTPELPPSSLNIDRSIGAVLKSATERVSSIQEVKATALIPK